MDEFQNTGTDRDNGNQKIKSIEILLEECHNLQNRPNDDLLYFRGECCNSWELRPSVMRSFRFERIRAQSGAFLISVFHERFERSEILQLDADIPVYDHYTLTVPSENKQYLLNDLRLLNITRESLFPGLDEAAKAITQRYAAE